MSRLVQLDLCETGNRMAQVKEKMQIQRIVNRGSAVRILPEDVLNRMSRIASAGGNGNASTYVLRPCSECSLVCQQRTSYILQCNTLTHWTASVVWPTTRQLSAAQMQ